MTALLAGAGEPAWIGSPFRRNGKPLNLFVLTQFRTEGYGEVAEPNRFTLFLELL
ncbi:MULTISPECIES: hypothetical protein [unclassified Mesorhizobium]|uniref:hypothetical protein n=1 Tax=unclassified Mesorhizobium TaxID=325217 RepID=UPI001679C805|nr:MULTISPECIES: hypothetical protein [unclassified Mesorhizobium]